MPQARMECSQQAETRSDAITRRATATRAHVESPLRTELFVDSCSVRHQGNCCASTRKIPATWISIRTQSTELARHKHTWISLRAQRNMFRRKDCCVLTLRAHLDVRKQTCSCDNTAALARSEHIWISLRGHLAQ